MRIFYALNFKCPDKNKMIGYSDLIKENAEKASYTSKPNIHLTLDYIGEVRPHDLKKYCTILDSLPNKRLDLTVNRLDSFPQKNKKVYWLGIEEQEELKNLVMELRYELSSNGLKDQFDKYTPHITLARNVVSKDVETELNPFGLEVKSIALYESKRVEDELVYEPLKEIFL